jgi:hypothetical protein
MQQFLFLEIELAERFKDEALSRILAPVGGKLQWG